MTDPNNRTVDAEIDFNSDGEAYFSWAIYVDSGEACTDEVLDYLNEEYLEVLFEAEQDARYAKAEEEYHNWER